MIESSPPTSHAVSITSSLPDAPATSDGIRKIPAPTTMPMVIANASRGRSTGRGRAVAPGRCRLESMGRG